MEKFNENEGVWRTIGGRRVFIRTGQSLSDAMRESGKFKTKSGKVKKEDSSKEVKEENIDKEEKNLSRAEKNKGLYEQLEKEQKKDIPMELTSVELKEKYGTDNVDLINAGKEKENRVKLKKENTGVQLSQKQIEAGNRLNANAEKGVRDDIKAFLSGKENYDGSQKDFIRDLSDNWGVDKDKVEDILHKENLKHPRNFKNEGQSKKEIEQAMSSKKTMTEEEFGKRIKEIQSTPSYKAKMDEAVEELNKKYGYPSKTDKTTNGDSKSETFIQNTNMYGGTREYNKEQLDRMKEKGVKPMKDSYTGGGWEGTKYDSKLTTKEIGKRVTDEMKKQFPDVKISRRGDNYSMGSSIDFNIMESEKDLFANASDIDKMSDKQVSDTIGSSVGGYTRLDEWLDKNGRKTANNTFTANDERDYLKEELSNYKSRKGDNVVGNEWYLSDYGKKVVSELNKQANSYTYSDSDGMVDYFDHGTYMHVSIGKWNKPYELKSSSSSSSDWVREAFNKYRQEHPATKMTFEDFKKSNK